MANNKVNIEFEARTDKVDAAFDKLSLGFDKVERKARQTVDSNKRATKEMGDSFSSAGGNLGAIERGLDGVISKFAIAATAAKTLNAVMQMNRENIEAVSKAGNQGIQSHLSYQQMVAGIGLSPQNASILERMTRGANSALTFDQRTQLAGAIAGTAKPGTEEEQRRFLQVYNRMLQADALSPEQATTVGRGAGALLQFAGVSPEQAVDLSTLAMQRGGSEDLITAAGHISGVLKTAAPNLSPEDRAAAAFALAEESTDRGFSPDAHKASITKLDKFRREGKIRTGTDPSGKPYKINEFAPGGAYAFASEGSTYEAYINTVARAQAGDKAALDLLTVIAESQASSIMSMQLPEFTAAREAFEASQGAGAALQNSMMQDSTTRRAIQARRQRSQNEITRNTRYTETEAKIQEEREQIEGLGLEMGMSESVIKNQKQRRPRELYYGIFDTIFGTNAGRESFAEYLQDSREYMEERIDTRASREVEERRAAQRQAALEAKAQRAEQRAMEQEAARRAANQQRYGIAAPFAGLLGTIGIRIDAPDNIVAQSD